MTISSAILLLGFTDLGIGNSVINAVAEADGDDNPEIARVYVSSAFFLLLGMASCLVISFALAYPFIPWAHVFNVTSALAVQEAGPSAAVFVIALAFNMPFGIVQRVQMGYQEGFKNNLWGIAGALFGLIGLLVAVYYKAGLPWLVIAVSGGPALALSLNWFEAFVWSKPWLRPRWRVFSWVIGRKIVNVGFFFLVLQLLALLGNSSDNIVIAQVLGASAVAGYSITQRLFAVSQVAQVFIQPLWPAFGEAMVRSDYAWARRTLSRSLVFSLVLGIAASIPLVVFGKQIITWWAGPDLLPSTSLLIGFSLWTLLAGYGGSMSVFLNNGAFLRYQTVFYAASSLTALLMKIILVEGTNSTSGAIWATVLAYGALYVIPSAKLAYGGLRRLELSKNK